MASEVERLLTNMDDDDDDKADATLGAIFGSSTLTARQFLAFRCAALCWLMGAGFALDWFPWSMRRPPVVFLTNWGFFVSAVHFMLSCGGLLGALVAKDAALAYPRLRSLATNVFAVAIVVEPLIVVGFWTLVYEEEGGRASPRVDPPRWSSLAAERAAWP